VRSPQASCTLPHPCRPAATHLPATCVTMRTKQRHHLTRHRHTCDTRHPHLSLHVAPAVHRRCGADGSPDLRRST
jgi:hypothetical protein